MAYLSLYRQYRPTTFDDLIGQEHIVKTLTGQIQNDRIGHAYLFCGSRGTGKTTAARIFARAINCLSPVNGSPCGKCAVCKELENPANLDIIEIDAASNNRVDEIRELRERVNFPPTVGKYKVYIIDEVHMLTDQAFNAFLKTLEEPPSYAVFILATTEIHKVPSTILSRCMRFDFRLIPEDKIALGIKKMFDDAGKVYEEDALRMIARAGRGSMRDAISVAEVCFSCADKLTYKAVADILGGSNRLELYKLIDSIIKNDSNGGLVCLAEMIANGKSVGVINSDILGGLRDVYVATTCATPEKILALPLEEIAKIKELSVGANKTALVRAIELFSQTENEIKYSTQPRIALETALIRACMPENDWNIEALLARIERLESALKKGAVINQPAQVVSGVANQKESVETQPRISEEQRAEEFYKDAGKRKNLADAKTLEILGLLNRRLRQNGEIMLWSLMQNLKLGIKGNVLTIFTANPGDKSVLEKPERIQTIKQTLAEYGDFEVKIAVINDNLDKKEIDDGFAEIKSIFGDIVKSD